MTADKEMAIEALEANGTAGERTPMSKNITLVWHDLAQDGPRPKGVYATLEVNDAAVWEDEVAEGVAKTMRRLWAKAAFRPKRALAVGLGNRHILCDRLGTDTIDRLAPSPRLALVCPMVRERTGLATADVVRALCEVAQADLVVAVDALVCRSPERLGRTVQLSNAPFCPGGGVGLPQKSLDETSLGVPFLTVGVPMLSFVDPYSGTLCVTMQDIEKQNARVAAALAKGIERAIDKEAK